MIKRKINKSHGLSEHHLHFYGPKQEKHIQILLNGCSSDRKKQFKTICRTYPDAKITRSAPIVSKTINGKHLLVEDANTPRTVVDIIL